MLIWTRSLRLSGVKLKQNIAAFGGDPENGTIFGEFAGGASVHSLITIPAAKGLFQKTIIESGGGRNGVLTGRPMIKDGANANYPVSAETIGINFARRHGIEGTDGKSEWWRLTGVARL